QLRLLQTVVAVAAEKNSTLVLPFPVELLRFLERAQQGGPPQQPVRAQESAPQPSVRPDEPRQVGESGAPAAPQQASAAPWSAVPEQSADVREPVAPPSNEPPAGSKTRQD
ncbi:slipin family protein, partial [Streptomyces sp. NPDC057094]